MKATALALATFAVFMAAQPVMADPEEMRAALDRIDVAFRNTCNIRSFIKTFDDQISCMENRFTSWGSPQSGDDAQARSAFRQTAQNLHAQIASGVLSQEAATNSMEEQLAGALAQVRKATDDLSASGRAVVPDQAAIGGQREESERAEKNDRIQRGLEAALSAAGNINRITPANPTPGTGPTAFYIREQISGLNKICYYNELGSVRAITIQNTQICPLTYHGP